MIVGGGGGADFGTKLHRIALTHFLYKEWEDCGIYRNDSGHLSAERVLCQLMLI